MLIRLVPLAALALAAAPTHAVEITRFEGLSPAQSAEAVAVVQDLFASINRLGVAKTIAIRFPDSIEASDAAQVQIYRELDASCGPITTAELVKEQAFGSQVVEQSYVTRMGECLVKWDVVLERQGGQWTFNWFTFTTLTGNRWEM